MSWLNSTMSVIWAMTAPHVMGWRVGGTGITRVRRSRLRFSFSVLAIVVNYSVQRWQFFIPCSQIVTIGHQQGYGLSAVQTMCLLNGCDVLQRDVMWLITPVTLITISDPSIHVTAFQVGWFWVQRDSETYLQVSSEHGSDGEPYVPEPSQNDEMVQQFRQHWSRWERTSELPICAPQPSASKSEDLTRRWVLLMVISLLLIRS
jgi:hypothetical protein